MARRPRSSLLEHRTARLKLEARKKPHGFVQVSPGIGIGYRRCVRGSGRWIVEVADGHGGRWQKAFAVADDFEEADGEHVLDFWTASERARTLARGQDSPGHKPVTVGDAVDAYERDLVARGGDTNNASRIRYHLTPGLASKPVGILRTNELVHWRDRLLKTVSQSTARRICRALAAALSLAAKRDSHIANRDAWRHGLSGLSDADRTRNAQVLTDAQVRAVVAAAYALSADYGRFVECLATTGQRASQLARLEVADLQADRADPRLMVPSSKKGRRRQILRRPVPIPSALATKLRQAARGRAPHEPLLSWRPSSNDWRTFKEAADGAGITGISPYSLRHSSIVRQLLAGTPTRLCASLHDTSVVVLERVYSRFIADHADQTARLGLLDLSAPESGNVVTIGRRP
jgi:integrase